MAARTNTALALATALDIWGNDWQYAPPGEGEPFTVTGIFDEAHEFVDAGAEVPLSTTAPAMTVALAAADVGTKVKPFPEGSEPARGGVFSRNGRSLAVVDVMPSGDDGALCPLHEA